MDCVFCKNKFSCNPSLKHHQKTAKYCLKLQGVKTKKYVCESCSKDVSTKHRLFTHYQSCDKYKKSQYSLKFNYEKQHLLDKISQLEKQIDTQNKHIEKLEDKLENIAIKAVQRPTYFEEEAVIEIDPEDDSGDSDNEEGEEKKEYELVPLDLGKGYEIEHREEDGYINVSNLCKAGGKQFPGWKRLQKTKAFLQVLSTSMQIHMDELIRYTSGSNNQRATWVHPQVAINIAQWISPKFDVKVSAWVYEVMMTGKVDITNTKSYRQLQEENKGHKIRIQHLTKKYMKKQPRLEIKETNVVYILTTKLMKNERRYILGKATNLTNRLSTYNKSDEHQIVYYQGCGDEDNMSTVETLVFQKLKSYREQANRERFVLPEDKEISLFVDTIKECVSFITK
jgi:hypothetical protein